MNYSVHSFTSSAHCETHREWFTGQSFPLSPTQFTFKFPDPQITSGSVAAINRLCWFIGGMSSKTHTHMRVMSAVPTERGSRGARLFWPAVPLLRVCVCTCGSSRQLGAACHSYVRGQYKGQDRYWRTMVICLVAQRQRARKKELSKLFKLASRSDKLLFLSMDKVENNEMLPSFSSPKLNYIFNIYLYVFKQDSMQLSNVHVNLVQKN